jgi:hypothetical protein
MKRNNILFFFFLLVGLPGILMYSCKDRGMNGMIIFTESPREIKNPDYVTGESWRFIPQARIVAVDPARPEKSMKILTEGFYSACRPEISFDGRHMLFAGQKKEGDTWQIWELDLENLKARQITSSEENCTDPAYLPGDRFVFSRAVGKDSLKAGNSLFTAKTDGSNIARITFNPSAYFAPSVLNDGRILAVSRQLYPETEDPFVVVIRPDGTKASLFYKNENSSGLFGRAWETADGMIVFAEPDSADHGKGKITAISYNRPLHSHVDLTAGVEGDFRSVFPAANGKLLVTYRKKQDDRYALYEFNSENHTLGKAVFQDQGFDILDVVVAREHIRPKKLPSEVDPGVKTGLLLCQDIGMVDPVATPGASPAMKATRVELLGLDASYGIIKVEKDGSFYLKAMADTPFRIQTLDEKGKVVNGPGAWIWLRPNERRGCIGCHEDPELAPDNNAPMSVRKDPVIIPVHITEVSEKEVELE